MHHFCASLGPATTPEHLALLRTGLPGATFAEHSAGGLAATGARLAGDTGRVALIGGHPEWREPRLAALAAREGDARALLDAWQLHRERLLEHLHGEFVCAVFDAPARRTFAATDRIGRRPLFHAADRDGVRLATTATALARALAAPLSAQGVFDYLYCHMVPSPGSAFEGVAKLPGAHYLDWRDGASRIVNYWRPRFEEPRDADVEALGTELRGLIRGAVGRLSPDGSKVGAFLSGGLDSSTVAGMLAGLRPDAADTYSIGFDVEGYDETPYARIAVRHFGTRQHEYYVSPDDVADAVPRIAAYYDEPFGNSSALPAYYCAKLAREDGVTRMLAGDGGDELFAGNARYAKQKVFELYATAPAPLQRLVAGASQALPARLPLVGKARSYVAQASVPLPDRLDSYNFLQRIAPERMFEPDFLARVDLEAPRELARAVYTRPEGASSLNRMMYLDWQRTLADNDLRKVNRMCELAGVDVAYPLLDDALVEFSCRVPSALKLRGQRLRHFYKEAMRGFLPEAILRKSKHGFGLPFGIWMREHPRLRELAHDSLERLKGRGIVRPDFIAEAQALHRDGHAAYYGELVWVLMMLGLWLDAHVA